MQNKGELVFYLEIYDNDVIIISKRLSNLWPKWFECVMILYDEVVRERQHDVGGVVSVTSHAADDMMTGRQFIFSAASLFILIHSFSNPSMATLLSSYI